MGKGTARDFRTGRVLTAMRSLGSLLFAGALVLASAPFPARAEGDPGGPEDQAYAGLFALQEAAENLQDNGEQDGDGKRAIIAEWEKLHDAALVSTLPDGSPHPLAYLADIKIASQLYLLGRLPEAMARARRGMEGLADRVDEQPLAYAEAGALIGVMMAQGGEAAEALPLVEAGHKRFTTFYDTLAPDERWRALIVSKSNLEFALSQVLNRVGENGQALEYQRLSLETRRDGLGENDPDTISSYYGYAQALQRNEQIAEADHYARLAVEKAVAFIPTSHPAYARSLEMLGIILSRTGRPIEATGYLTRALELKRENEGPDNLYFAYGIHNLGTILFNRELYRDAEPFFLEADPVFREFQGENSPYAAGAMAHAGRIAFAEGRVDQAVERLLKAESQLGANMQDDEILLRIQPDLIRGLIAQDKTGEALARAASHLAQVNALESETPFSLAHARLLRDRAASAAGDGDPAEEHTAVLGLVAQLRNSQEVALGGTLSTDRRAALDLAMEVAAGTGDADAMLQAMGLISGSSVAHANAMRSERLAAQDPELAEAIRLFQDAATSAEESERAWLAALPAGEVSEQLQAEREATLAARDMLGVDLNYSFPEWAASRPQFEPSLAALQQSLARDEALLTVMPGYNGSYLLLVTHDAALPAASPIGRAEMLALAGRLSQAVRAGSFDPDSARQLHRAIVIPEFAPLLAGKSALRIHASGALASLPFALLQDPAAGDGAGWLIDRFMLTSASDLLPHPAAAAPRGPLETYAAIAATAPFAGAAAHAGSEDQSGSINSFFDRQGVDTASLAELPPLPDTRLEAESVAGLFDPAGTTLLMGPAAQEAALTSSAIADADVLLFATHGLVAGEIEGVAEPALVLSPPSAAGMGDGLLTVSEIAGLKLASDWVILSACNSAAGSAGGLPAFTGLAQAFRYAGAGTLLVSHWQVRDDIAAFITIETLRAYRQGLSKPAALQAAIRKLRASPDIAGATEPFAWAPFVLLD